MSHFVLGPAVTREDIPALCAGLAGLLRGRPGHVVRCDVGGVGRPDVVLAEALARLVLTARRHGGRLMIEGAGPELLGLMRLVGLAELLGEPVGEAEHREEPGRVEEVVDRGDPAA